jgi:hypothetical protein
MWLVKKPAERRALAFYGICRKQAKLDETRRDTCSPFTLAIRSWFQAKSKAEGSRETSVRIRTRPNRALKAWGCTPSVPLVKIR